MLNKKQEAILSIAVNQAIKNGSGIQIADRPLEPGEFAPTMSAKESGGLIFNNLLIPQDAANHIGFSFIPTIDADGQEMLGLFMHAGRKLVPVVLINPKDAGSLVSDLMLSASHYQDPLIAAAVTKTVQDCVIASDMPLKEALLGNTKKAINDAFESAVQARLEVQQKQWAAALSDIEEKAQIKASKKFSAALLAVADIASTDQLKNRLEMLEEIMPEIKSLCEMSLK